MFESELQISGSQKYLTCWYDPGRFDWDQVIERALLRHKLKPGECGILCLPMTDKKECRVPRLAPDKAKTTT